MKKRILPILLVTLLFLAQTVMPVFAEGGAFSGTAASAAAEAAREGPADPAPEETGPAQTEPTEPEPEPTEPEPEPTEPEPTEPTEPEPTEPEPEPRPDETHTAYVHGDNTGAFRPDNSLNRAELAQILYNAGQYPSEEGDSFPDVSPDAWYAPAVLALYQAGLLDGYPDGSYRPTRAVTRAELVTVLARLWNASGNGASDGGEDGAPELTFSDVSDSHWAVESIFLARDCGWVDGYPDGSFRPDRSVTRAEAVTMLNRFWGRVPDRDAIDADPDLRFFPDVDPDDWFYYDVMEAAVSHSAHWEAPDPDEQWTERFPSDETLEDGFRCIEGRLYLVLDGSFLRTAGEGSFNETFYACEGASGVCTAEGSALQLFDGQLILLMQDGTPMYSPGGYPEGFYYHDGAIYAAKSGLLVQTAGTDVLLGCSFSCEGESGHCIVDGPVLPCAVGPWYRLVDGAVDLTPGLYSSRIGMYYVQEDGTLLRNGEYQGLRFGGNAAYTSGNSRIDTEMDRIVALVTEDDMTPEEKLFACYRYVFSISLNYLSNNNHVPRGQDCSLWAETYMLRLLNQNGRGNCYCFAAEYYYLCRRVGFWQAKAVSGGLYYRSYDHGWVEMTLNGTCFLFDPRTDARYNKTPGALFMIPYAEAPYTYFPPD